MGVQLGPTDLALVWLHPLPRPPVPLLVRGGPFEHPVLALTRAVRVRVVPKASLAFVKQRLVAVAVLLVVGVAFGPAIPSVVHARRVAYVLFLSLGRVRVVLSVSWVVVSFLYWPVVSSGRSGLHGAALPRRSSKKNLAHAWCFARWFLSRFSE